MQPGLSRAIPMAILGFLFGALLVIIIRGLQQLDPLWAPGPGIILSAFTMAGFFVWGMGAFDPKLSAHGEAEEAAREALAKEAEEPQRLLVNSVWQLAALLVLLLVALGGFAALPGGLAKIQTISDYASPTMVGFVPFQLPFGGPTIMLSQLVLFAVFIIWAFISLVLVAGVIGWIIFYLARNINEVKVAAATAGGGATAALPAPAAQEPTQREVAPQSLWGIFQVIGVLIVLSLVLNWILGLISPHLQIPVLASLVDTATQITLLAIFISAVVVWLVFRGERVIPAVPFVVAFLILYAVFYYVAIGLIFPQPSVPPLSFFFDSQTQLIILSAVNAFVFTFVILRTQLVLTVIGRVAGWLAHVLRSIPKFLQ